MQNLPKPQVHTLRNMVPPQKIRYVDRLCSDISSDQNSEKVETRDTPQIQVEEQEKNTPLYNEGLNPRQIDYPNILGFNDLHIHAIRHGFFYIKMVQLITSCRQ